MTARTVTSPRSSLRRALHTAAWILVNLLGAIICLGAICLLALSSAIALDWIQMGWGTFAWLCVAEVGTAVVSLVASGELSRRDAPPGSWATH